MVKTLDSNQIQKLDSPSVYPIYLCHILLSGETLYFSDRCFRYNGHDYEDYLLNLPQTAQRIERLGGYFNLNASLIFKNMPLRAYNYLTEFFAANPITRREMELYILYHKKDEAYGSDVSTKLFRAAIGQKKDESRKTFVYEIFSILHHLDNKNIFTEINRTNWANAAPDAIGKYENIWHGALRDVPCHCVQTYAVSTLFLDLAASGETYITLSDVDYPIAFASTGCVQIGSEQIDYSAKDSTNKRLTVQTRGVNGTTASIHKRGTPCWLIETPVGTALTFKYLASGHQMKAISVVYAGSEKIRIDAANYTASLNDGGKSTITFTQRQIQKVLEIISSTSMDTGSHRHSSQMVTPVIATGGSITETTWTHTGTESVLRDQNDQTGISATGGSGNCRATLTFPAWGGGTITAVYFCVTFYSISGSVVIQDDHWNTVGTLPVTAMVLSTSKFKVSQNHQPAEMCVYGSGNGGMYIREMWIEVESSETGASAATGVNATVTVSGQDSDVIAPLIVCDGEGYKDDGSGTYTGTPDALIENPSDYRRHVLVALYGRLMSEIGDSFGTMRTTYAGRISGGYKFASILSRLGLKPSEIFRRLDEQSRSNMREDGGKFELSFNSTSDPSTVVTIDKWNWKSEPIFSETPSSGIRNKIRAVYDLDWSGIFKGRKFGDYKKQTERPNAASITKYGELSDDVEFPTIQVQAMAEDVGDWIVLQKKDVISVMRVPVDHSARKVERGDYVLLLHDISTYNNTKWRVLEITEIPSKQTYLIEAIQFISS